MKRVQFIKVFGLGSQYSDAAPELNAYMAKNPDHMIKTMTGNEGLLVVCFEQEVLPKHSEEPPHDRLFDKYEVKRRDGKAIKGGIAIVLEVGDKDARDALTVYAATMRDKGYNGLATDIMKAISR
jgi:hypothetical protein